jgi:4-amino-4-deoxy-L-arabinose transferase-like glycosyltransferase
MLNAGRKIDWSPILAALGTTTYLYLNLFSFPDTPFLLGGDQVYFWTDAQRMLDGARIYQDFFQFTPPGTDLLYFALFKLFGANLWVANAVVLVLGVALCWFCFVLASEIMGRQSALLATVFFLVLIYGKLLSGTHHLFSVLAIMGAVNTCVRKMTGARILLAGALLGLASLFTQTHGTMALLAFATFLICRRLRTKGTWADLLRNQSLLLLGYAVTLLLLNAYFIATVGLKQLWYLQVTYVRQYVVSSPLITSMGLPEPLAWHTLPKLSQYLFVYLLLPIIYPVALWRCWSLRRSAVFPWERVALLSTVGFFLFLEVVFSPNWLRLYSVSMAGIILLVWAFDQARKVRPYLAVLTWVGIGCLAVQQTRSGYVHRPLRVHLPGGEVATSSEAYGKLYWVMLHTTPGQFFFQADWPGMYFPLKLRNPVFLDIVLPGEGTRPEDISSAIQQLEGRQVRYVLWAARLDHVDDVLGPSKDHVAPLRAYLHTKYTRVQVFSDGDAVLQRNEFTGRP